MAVLKCKMCGGNLEITGMEYIAQCSHCGVLQTLPKADDEKKLALFNRANNLRRKNEFDKAAGIFESIIVEFPDEAEAYWGVVMCKYGLEYVDGKDGRKVPTCHRTLPVSIMNDEDFLEACNRADISARSLYQDEAKAIDGIQKKILEIAATEEPYDIFICYKEKDDVTGLRTEDSSIAQDIYTALTEMGYKVFYSRNSLRKLAGTEFEPYIYAALSSAKIMLAIGTRLDYYDAVWVKNEWSRFISMMADDSSKVLIPCYKNMDAYDIPEEFGFMQALNMSDVMFSNNLEASVKRALPLESKVSNTDTAVINSGATATVDTLLKRAYMFLEDGEFFSAGDYFERVLDIDPENAHAYMGKTLEALNVKKIEDIVKCDKEFSTNSDFCKALRFADSEFKAELEQYLNDWRENRYNIATNIMNGAKSGVDYKIAADIFRTLYVYKDSQEKRTTCVQQAKYLTDIKTKHQNLSLEINKRKRDVSFLKNNYQQLESQYLYNKKIYDEKARKDKLGVKILLLIGSILPYFIFMFIHFAFLDSNSDEDSFFDLCLLYGYLVLRISFGISWAIYNKKMLKRGIAGSIVRFLCALIGPIWANIWAFVECFPKEVKYKNDIKGYLDSTDGAMNQCRNHIAALEAELAPLTVQENQLLQLLGSKSFNK